MSLVERYRRHLRVRKKVNGTAERPRLVVFRSLKHIYAQIVDDDQHKTLVGVSDLSEGLVKEKPGKVGAADAVGKLAAQKAKAGIDPGTDYQVVVDPEDIAHADMPGGPAGHFNVLGSWSYGILKYSKNQEAAKALLSLKPRPTAIFAGNDEMAAGAIQAAREHGLMVPQDLSIVGYDDFKIALVVWPQLTTIHTPTREIGRLAGDKVMGRDDSRLEADPARLPSLVVRASTASLQRRPRTRRDRTGRTSTGSSPRSGRRP